jgi:6-pyruvoyl-tetrahydropterin synthase
VVYLTFAGEFNAIHRLWNDAFTPTENVRAFAECSNLHGHRFRVEVTVAADVSRDRPAAISRSMIRNTVVEVLAPKLRNGNLNETFGKGFMATGENLVRVIWHMLRPALASEAALVRVRLVETRKNSFVYYGEEGAPEIFSPTAV